MKKIIKHNSKFNTIELRFAKKPGNSILERLRRSEFKWAPTKKQWYAKKTVKNEAFTKDLGSSAQTKLAL